MADKHDTEKEVVFHPETPHESEKEVREHDEPVIIDGVPVSNLPEVLTLPPTPRDHPKYAIQDEQPSSRNGIFASRRNRLIIAFAVVLLIIGAAVVGAVVGVLEHKAKKSTGNSTESAETSTSKGVRDDSAIAVTGWNNGFDYSIRLFYQDWDDNLRMSSLESEIGDTWTVGTVFAKARSQTPLAASSHNASVNGNLTHSKAMQAHVFYLDETNTLQEFVFQQDAKTGTIGSLNTRNIKVHGKSQLGAYWPSLSYQTPDNSLNVAKYNCSTSNDNCWNLRNLNLPDLYPGTSSAIVPRERNLTGLWLYYQNKDNNIMNLQYTRATDQWVSAEYSHPAPHAAHISVLVTPRTADGFVLNFNLMYQTSDGTLTATTKDATGWNDPTTYPALSNSMNGTNIACLNAYSWIDKTLDKNPEMNRCFWLGRKGQMRQSQWVGKSWKDLGIIVNVGKA